MHKKLKQLWNAILGNGYDPALKKLVGQMGSYSSAGQAVTPSTVLSNPAVLNGIRAIATNCSRVPYDVYKRNKDGSRERDTNHPAQHILHRPNKYTNRSVLFSSWVVNAIIWGNGFIHIERDNVGNPIKLTLLDPSATGIVIEENQIYYYTSQWGKYHKLEYDEVLHLRGLSDDGISGLPLYQVLAEAFGLGLTLQRYTNVYFANGNKPGLVITLPEECSSPEDIEEFRNAWMGVHAGGVQNSFRPALCKPGSTIQVLPNNNDSAQLSEIRESDLVAVANALGLPSNIINGRMSSVAYGSVQAEKMSFLEVIDSWTVNIEEEFSSKLLRTNQVKSHYIEGNRKALIKVTPEVEAELIIKYRNNGLLSDEEARQMINKPIKFTEGTYWLPSSLVTRQFALEKKQHESIKEIKEDEPEDNDEDKKKLTKSTVARLLRRAEKSGMIETSIWDSELGFLPGYTKLSLPVEELAHVLPEQRSQIINNINIDKIVETLWS